MLFANTLTIKYPRRRIKPYILERLSLLIEQVKQKYRISTTFCDLSDTVIFEHGDGTFKAIDFGDRDNPEKFDSKEIIENKKCAFVLKCQLRQTINHPKIRPFFYWDKGNKQFSADIPRYRKNTRNKNLYFRGNTHLGRKQILDKLSDVLNQGYDLRVAQEQYFMEMSRHRFALSLRGMAKSCHREFEAFAVGTPVIMQYFPNVFYVNLIPDFHYISVNEDERGLAACIRDRLGQVNEELWQFVRKNAMEYYDTYIRFESSVEWTRKLLEL